MFFVNGTRMTQIILIYAGFQFLFNFLCVTLRFTLRNPAFGKSSADKTARTLFVFCLYFSLINAELILFLLFKNLCISAQSVYAACICVPAYASQPLKLPANAVKLRQASYYLVLIIFINEINNYFNHRFFLFGFANSNH